MSKVEHEKEVERSVCIDAIQEKVSEVGEDKREIRGIYEGRLYSKRTTPMRVGWLVGCFGFNGPLRQYFSLYQAVSQREGERGEKG